MLLWGERERERESERCCFRRFGLVVLWFMFVLEFKKMVVRKVIDI